MHRSNVLINQLEPCSLMRRQNLLMSSCGSETTSWKFNLRMCFTSPNTIPENRSTRLYRKTTRFFLFQSPPCKLNLCSIAKMFKRLCQCRLRRRVKSVGVDGLEKWRSGWEWRKCENWKTAWISEKSKMMWTNALSVAILVSSMPKDLFTIVQLLG